VFWFIYVILGTVAALRREVGTVVAAKQAAKSA
jgi:hypothetical protein